MDSRTKVFRAHRAIAWFYGFVGFAICAAVFIGNTSTRLSDLPVAAAFSALFCAHYFTAKACMNNKPWGRKASIGIACLMLLAFPMGTLIGIYLLSNTWKPWPTETA